MTRILLSNYYDDDIVLNHLKASEVFTQILAVISGIVTFSVVFILIYRYKVLVSNKDFVHYVLMIAINDFFTCLTYCWGFPYAGDLCSVQSFITSFAARGSWFWTDVLILQLCYLVVYKRHFLTPKQMHVIVWSLNIILQFLPFSTETYYGTKKGPTYGICDFYNRNTDDYTLVDRWNDTTFNGWLYFSFLLIVFCSVFVIFYSRMIAAKHPLSASLMHTAAFNEAWKTIILYPLAMLVAYIPAQCAVLYYNSSLLSKIPQPNTSVDANYLVALNTLYGLFLSIIFYLKTDGAIYEWKMLYQKLINVNNDNNVINNDIECRTTSTDLPKALADTLNKK